jgi:hypothetical protein
MRHRRDSHKSWEKLDLQGYHDRWDTDVEGLNHKAGIIHKS